MALPLGGKETWVECARQIFLNSDLLKDRRWTEQANAMVLRPFISSLEDVLA